MAKVFATTVLFLALRLSSSSAEVIHVGGTGGATQLLVHLGISFTQLTGIAVDVIPSLGSGGGISAAADGVLDVAVSGRPLSAAERAKGLVQAATVMTPYVFATSYDAPPSMTEREIVSVYATAKPTWPDGTHIKLILRPRAESDLEVLVALFPGMAPALALAQHRTELPIAATDQDNADAAEVLTGSFIATTFTQMVTENRHLRLIPINGVPPSIAAVEGGTYRYTKALYVIMRQQPTPAGARLVQFLRSDDGKRSLREAGCLPGTD